jgi:uncharacterized protein (TIGR04255 family)
MDPISRTYKSPPIIEAVIAFRASPSLIEEDMAALRDEFSKEFPNIQQRFQINFRAQPPGKSAIDEVSSGYHLKDETALRQIIIDREDLSTCLLAPYPGWPHLEAFAIKNLRRARTRIGYKKISRIGVRFQNRLDLDVNSEGIVEITEYIKQSPENRKGDIPYNYEFFHHVTQYIADRQRRILVQIGSVEPAVIGKASFMIDIDVSLMHDVPQNIEAIEAEIRIMRGIKNDVFERLITDKARLIFDREGDL